MARYWQSCPRGVDPGNATPGATPAWMGFYPPIHHNVIAPYGPEGVLNMDIGSPYVQCVPTPIAEPCVYPPVGPGGLLNLDIGPGLLDMDICNPHGFYHMDEGQRSTTTLMRIHVVLQCDTIYRLARLYNIDEHVIIQANRLSSPNAIFPGQRLIIPGGTHY